MRKLKPLRLAMAAFAMGAVAPALPLAAQETEDAALAPEYFDLHAAMEEAVDEAAAMDASLDVMRRAFEADPNFIVLEQQSPGLIDEVVAGMRPILEGHSKRVNDLYRPRMAAIFARHLTPEEAAIAAEFYRSDIGRRLMKAASGNYSPESAVEGIQNEGTVTQEGVNRDIDNAIAATMRDLSPEDQAELGRTFLQNPALMKLQVVQNDVRAVRLQMENEPLLPEDEQAIEAMMTEIFQRRFPGM